MSLDFGGQRGCATASGIIDGVGYLAGVLSGSAMAKVEVTFGWQSMFLLLAGIAMVSSVVAALAVNVQRKRAARLHLIQASA